MRKGIYKITCMEPIDVVTSLNLIFLCMWTRPQSTHITVWRLVLLLQYGYSVFPISVPQNSFPWCKGSQSGYVVSLMHWKGSGHSSMNPTGNIREQAVRKHSTTWFINLICLASDWIFLAGLDWYKKNVTMKRFRNNGIMHAIFCWSSLTARAFQVKKGRI